MVVVWPLMLIITIQMLLGTMELVIGKIMVARDLPIVMITGDGTPKTSIFLTPMVEKLTMIYKLDSRSETMLNVITT